MPDHPDHYERIASVIVRLWAAPATDDWEEIEQQMGAEPEPHVIDIDGNVYYLPWTYDDAGRVIILPEEPDGCDADDHTQPAGTYIQTDDGEIIPVANLYADVDVWDARDSADDYPEAGASQGSDTYITDDRETYIQTDDGEIISVSELYADADVGIEDEDLTEAGAEIRTAHVTYIEHPDDGAIIPVEELYPDDLKSDSFIEHADDRETIDISELYETS